MGTDTLTDVTVAEHQFTGTDNKRVHIYLYMYICVTLTPCIKGLPGNYNTTDNGAYTVHICGLTLYSVYAPISCDSSTYVTFNYMKHQSTSFIECLCMSA